jgi:iron complex transport system ATP-binding protein
MMGRPDPVLGTEGLTVQVGPRTLVQALDLRVQAGEFWCLLGPNGAGKTLLLNTLAGARPASAGLVKVAGQALADWPPLDLARWRGHAPQQVHDAFSQPVLAVVLQGRHPHLSRWQWEGEEDLALAQAALARVGLAGFEARDVTTLSGGERQRVVLATLLVQQPSLLLLDEPLAHLDLAQQLQVLDLLADEVAQQRRAVLMSVHDLSLAQRVASHVLLLAGNGQARMGPVAEVMTEAALSAAFGHRLHRVPAQGRIWWLPG